MDKIIIFLQGITFSIYHKLTIKRTKIDNTPTIFYDKNSPTCKINRFHSNKKTSFLLYICGSQKQFIMTTFEFGVIVFTSFFSIINPLGVMPVFMSLTSDMSQQRKTKTAIKAVLISLLTLMLFVVTGQLIFKLFSISVDSLRIVGGVIFFMMGYDMLQAKLVRVKMDDPEEMKNYASDIAITPLAIPMICGPGAITNAIVLWEDAPTFEMKAVLIVGILSVLIIMLIVLIGSGKIVKFLGETGNKVMMRIMGLIVMVIAVEFFFAGLGPLISRMLE